jgi:hypothetical protein
MIRNLWHALLSLALLATSPLAAKSQQLIAQSESGRTKATPSAAPAAVSPESSPKATR